MIVSYKYCLNYDKLIEYIIKVDNDDELYQSYMNKLIYSS